MKLNCFFFVRKYARWSKELIENIFITLSLRKHAGYHSIFYYYVTEGSGPSSGEHTSFPLVPVVAGTVCGVVLLAGILVAALCLRSKTKYPKKQVSYL